MPPAIRVQDLDKAYGSHHLFDDASFQIEHGDHVAIVGGNGAGKSTLLRILAGRERADRGLIEVDPALRTHFFDQHPTFPEGATVRDVLVAQGTAPAPLLAEKEELETRIGDPALYETSDYHQVLERYAEVEQAIREATAAGRSADKNPLASELGIDDELLDQSMVSLSGGQRTRVFLARTLAAVRAGDLVVLDEPTNHLDVETIEWLEARIQTFDGTVLVVAHDRLFLDNVAERVLEVATGRVTAYPGNYSDFLQLRTQWRETQARERERIEREAAQVRAVVQQFRHQKRFDGQMASRQKILEKYESMLDRTPDPVIEKLQFDLRFGSVDKSSMEVIRAVGIRKGFGSRPVLARADLEVMKGDRIGLVGPNGAGKSTLLKIFAGFMPMDDGDVRIPPGVRSLYYSQERTDLDVNKTVREQLLTVRPRLEDNDIKALIGRFRFNPESDIGRRVSSLSGGERARLALLQTILAPSNLLLLDEPTNHLDLEAREVVVRALNAYKGTILMVSHDRFVLDSVTTKTAVLDRGQIGVYPGGFTATRAFHRSATTLGIRRDKYRVTKGFKDFNDGTKYAFGTEIELSPEELEGKDAFRRAFRFGMLERIG